MSEEERRSWEQSQGFKSYATKCNELFEDLEQKGIKSDNDILDFVSKNQDYFYIYQDENGDKYLESYLDGDFSYFVGNEQLLQIGERLYKFFKEGIVVSDKNHLQEMKQIKSFSLNDKFDGVEYYASKQYKCSNPDWKLIFRETNGKNRTLAELRLQQMPPEFIFPYEVQFFMRPYFKVLGIWYWCKRHLSWDISASWEWKQRFATGILKESKSDKGRTYDTEYSHTSILGSIKYEVYYFKFTYINGWADTPSTDKCYCYLK